MTATSGPLPSLDDPNSKYVWRIHHPYSNNGKHVAVEVAPKKGLITRWRFVIPERYQSEVEWGVGPPGGGPIGKNVRDRASGGPITLVGGPTVKWFGGGNPLSSTLSAYFVFNSSPPHYLAFGEADEQDGPPMRLEGISFGDHNLDHPTEKNDNSAAQSI